MLPLKPADIIFTHNPSVLGKLIRFFTRRINEPKTYTNHVAGIGPKEKVTVIEALWHVVETPWAEWEKDNPQYEVWRYRPLNYQQRIIIAEEARQYVGRSYGWWKLLLHGADETLSKLAFHDIFLFRRLMFSDRYPICSWVWSWPLDRYKIPFGSSPKTSNPDTMRDYFEREDSGWKMIAKK